MWRPLFLMLRFHLPATWTWEYCLNGCFLTWSWEDKTPPTFGDCMNLISRNPFFIKFSPCPLALQVLLSAGRDCLIAGDSCSSDENCSPRLRTLRQCVAGNGSMKLGPGARSQCANAVSALLSSPLHGCQCRRGMKREKNCLSIYWSLHQSGIHGEKHQNPGVLKTTIL